MATKSSNLGTNLEFLLNIKNKDWDTELLDIFSIPKNSLPTIAPIHFNFGNLLLDK